MVSYSGHFTQAGYVPISYTIQNTKKKKNCDVVIQQYLNKVIGCSEDYLNIFFSNGSVKL